jgi:predicted ribosomally synthesized peptide with SipW-like signal peptide
MNKKILGSLAGMVAVLGLVAGGTFAAWTAQESIDDNKVTAGSIQLDLYDQDGVSQAAPFDIGPIAPGADPTRYYRQWTVASALHSPELDADLFVTIENLDVTPAGNTLGDELRLRVDSGILGAGDSCGFATSSHVESISPLSAAVGTPIKIAEFRDSTGGDTCVMVRLEFPASLATNNSMNGVAEFDAVFDLVQLPK